MDPNKFYFCGTEALIEERNKFREFLTRCNICCEYSMNSERGYYYITNNHMRRCIRGSVEAQQLARTRSLMNINDFIRDFYDTYLDDPSKWYLRLNVGDIVTIGDRQGKSSDYPQGFTNNMAKLAGNTYEIVNVCPSVIRDSYTKDLPFYNGDICTYILKDVPFIWHSSMFVNENNKPIKKIQISEFPIFKLI